MYDLETVKIDDGKGGYIIINATDFDADKHKLHEEEIKENFKKVETKKDKKDKK